MKDLHDHDLRHSLLSRYLDGETSPQEERRLAAYLRQHLDELPADERAVSLLVIGTAAGDGACDGDGLSDPDGALADTDSAETFDRLCDASEAPSAVRPAGVTLRRRWRLPVLAASLAAAACLCGWLFLPSATEEAPVRDPAAARQPVASAAVRPGTATPVPAAPQERTADKSRPCGVRRIHRPLTVPAAAPQPAPEMTATDLCQMAMMAFASADEVVMERKGDALLLTVCTDDSGCAHYLCDAADSATLRLTPLALAY